VYLVCASAHLYSQDFDKAKNAVETFDWNKVREVRSLWDLKPLGFEDYLKDLADLSSDVIEKELFL